MQVGTAVLRLIWNLDSGIDALSPTYVPGELALNVPDQILYYRMTDGTLASIRGAQGFTGTFYASATLGGVPNQLVTVANGLIVTVELIAGEWLFDDAANSGQFLTVGF